MKSLFWVLTVLSVLVSGFLSFTCYLAHGLDLAGTGFGEMVCIVGMTTVLVCVICCVLGVIRLRKGGVKKALVFTLIALVYCGAVIGGLVLDDAMHTKRLEADIAERDKQLYGENWNDPPAIEGIPEKYQEVLNKFYAVVRDRWPAEELQNLGAVSMPACYGEVSTDNIGFVLMDLNGDKMDEVVIGTTAAAGEGGTVIFCIYTDTENPNYAINSVEEKLYYLHPGETAGTYVVEIAGRDSAWIIDTAQEANTFGITLREGAMDPGCRMNLDMIPFSEYK